MDCFVEFVFDAEVSARLDDFYEHYKKPFDDELVDALDRVVFEDVK